MLSLTGCTVVLGTGVTLRRQRVVLGEDGVLRAFDRRTGKPTFEGSVTGFVQVSNKRWEMDSDSGRVVVTKSGCGCGR
jgi:hypothetical protein